MLQADGWAIVRGEMPASLAAAGVDPAEQRPPDLWGPHPSEPKRVLSPGGWTPPPGVRPGWNWAAAWSIPPGGTTLTVCEPFGIFTAAWLMGSIRPVRVHQA